MLCRSIQFIAGHIIIISSSDHDIQVVQKPIQILCVNDRNEKLKLSHAKDLIDELLCTVCNISDSVSSHVSRPLFGFVLMVTYPYSNFFFLLNGFNCNFFCYFCCKIRPLPFCLALFDQPEYSFPDRRKKRNDEVRDETCVNGRKPIQLQTTKVITQMASLSLESLHLDATKM